MSDDLRQALGGARVFAWACPVGEHRMRRGVATVEWRGSVAHCTAPGCPRTNLMGVPTATAHEGLVHLDVPDDRSMLTYEETVDWIERLQCAAREALDYNVREQMRKGYGESVSLRIQMLTGMTQQRLDELEGFGEALAGDEGLPWA